MAKSNVSRSPSVTPHGKGKRARTALMETPPATEQIVIGVLRASWALESRLDKFMSSHGITLLQYNVIRICYVRDVDGTGIPSGAFAAFTMRLVPDVSRLIDRLVTAGFFERLPSPTDRRVVLIRLTPAGHDLVEKIHPVLLAHNKKLLEHLPEAELEKIAKGVTRILEGPLGKRDE